MDDYWWEEASCPECGTPHVPVRPGKTQPTCGCGFCGGMTTCHAEEDPRWPRMLGEWCDDCGPFRTE